MTKEKARELSSILIAYSNGEEIEFQSVDGDWYECIHPTFDYRVDYRVKPKSEYRPFTYDEFFDLMFKKRFFIRVKDSNAILNISSFSKDGVRLSYCATELNYNILCDSYEIIFENRATQPCGVKL